jgi:iron complex transport system substrate-binding protein
MSGIALTALVLALSACGGEDAPASPPAVATDAPMSSPAVAAGSAPTSNITEGCVDTYSPDVDYFPDKITIEEATDFEVRYKNNYKVLTVRTDLVSPGMSPQVVVMVQCGTPAPELTGDLAGATLIEVPVTTFGLTRNDDLASAVALGLTDNLVTHGFSSVFPEDINARIQSGEISHNAGAFGAQDMDFEAVAGKDPDVMFVLLSSEAGLAGVERLAALGIPTVPTLTSVSTNVLGRAEWAKVIALPFNQEARANDVLGDVLDTYRDLSAQARSQADKPTAIFAQCGANGECTVARNSWQAKIMEDAGLVNVLADPSAPQRLEPMAIEQVFEAGADADWMIIFSPPGSQYTGPLLASFRSYQQGQIISHDADGVSIRDGVYEYFYSGALRPDLLLRDIVALVYPGLAPEHTTTYMGISPLTQQ